MCQSGQAGRRIVRAIAAVRPSRDQMLAQALAAVAFASALGLAARLLLTGG